MARDDGQNGTGRSRDPGLSARSRRLTDALRTDQIEVHFLPTVELRTGRAVGAEALVRWAHPRRGLLTASEFLPDASPGGPMRELTERVIELSTGPAGDWRRSGLPLEVSVNLPSAMFSGPDWKLDDLISKALAQAELPPDALSFEITEEALTQDAVADRLGRLTELGASISIDDFGTGRFSIPQLASLPIKEIKIDRSFTRDIGDDDGMTILRPTINLAHQMDLRVVAEGVETEDGWDRLRGMGVDRAQGFFISEPLPARRVPGWLAAWHQRARELNSTRWTRRAPPTAAASL
jgi:EAL domain-containing protein (putative c-di-GMP-specific phosphodiesterase class I)